MKLIKEAYISWNAEVVFITSNWQGNKEMMEGCKEAGIPAFVSLLRLILVSSLSDVVAAGDALGLLTNSMN